VECNADPVAPDPLGGAYRLMLSAKSFSNTAAMPAANVNGGNVIVRWNISNATLGTASVQVNWKISLAPSDNNKGTFTISDIRVGSTTRTLKVKDIRLHINGQESKTFTAFSKVDQVIAPIANGVPTNETQSLNQNFRLIAPTGGQIMTETIPFENDTDSLALEFKVLGDSNSIATPIPEDVDPTTLPEPQLYLAVADILYTRCYSCHQSINQFRLTQNAANDRATIISKTSVANPANSLLLRKGTGLEVNHGEYIVRSTEAGMREYNLILAWISKLPAN